MQKNDLLSQLLKLNDDWSISSFETDKFSNRIDITLRHKTQKKPLFRRIKIDAENTIVLRHLPLMEMRTYLHFFKPTIETYGQYWQATNNPTLTKEMEVFVIEALQLCHNAHGVTRLAHLSTAEIKNINGATFAEPNDSHIGTTKKTRELESPEIDDEVTRLDHISRRSFELVHSDRLPPETDEAWTRLLDGNIPINPKSIALQMLLQQIRKRNKSSPTEINRLAGTKLLRTYMIKNQKKHAEEIAILHRDTEKKVVNKPSPIVAKSKPATDTKELPGIGHVCWTEVISGNMQINTDKVGLQMMMQQILSTVTGHADTAQNARLLYEFFWKHQNRLKKEIAQIHTFISEKEPTYASQAPLSLPSSSAAIWEQIITGKITVDTDSVSMQMMMQSITLAVKRDDSELSKIAATKLLQKFFVKNQKKLQKEIRQLINDPTMNQSTETNANKKQLNTDNKVPSDTHPSWQKLINGELEIKTNIVALKMMLQSIRISINKNPSDNSRIAGVKILRQYFLKHRNKHQAEINQLLVA